MSSPRIIDVAAAFDAEARVWFVEESDLPGLNAEGATIEELLGKLSAMVADLIQDDRRDARNAVDVLIELTAHTSTLVRLAA